MKWDRSQVRWSQALLAPAQPGGEDDGGTPMEPMEVDRFEKGKKGKKGKGSQKGCGDYYQKGKERL